MAALFSLRQRQSVAGVRPGLPGRRCRHPRFTLVEMLVVLVVVAILIAIASPIFDKLTVGTGVDAAERMVATKLQLCRQYAIAKREKVALVMPADSQAPNPGDAGDKLAFNYRFTSMRPAIVSGSSSPFAFVRWVEDTAWDMMPAGSCINEADDDHGLANPKGTYLDKPYHNGFSKVAIPKAQMSQLEATADGEYRCLVFSPSGRVLGDTLCVTVSDTTYAPPGGKDSWITRPGNNEFTVVVNAYTGRTLVKQASEYLP